MFYEFDQNNSGGIFIINENLDKRVIIEAPSEKLAILIAKDIGIYFNGCDEGIDCDCCGDRWSEFPDEIENIFTHNFNQNTKIHFLSGEIKQLTAISN